MTRNRMMREKDGWRYRRWVVFVLTALGVVLPFVPSVNADVYWPAYTLVTGAVGAYIGFATAEDMDRRRSASRRVRPRMDNPDEDWRDEA